MTNFDFPGATLSACLTDNPRGRHRKFPASTDATTANCSDCSDYCALWASSKEHVFIPHS